MRPIPCKDHPKLRIHKWTSLDGKKETRRDEWLNQDSRRIRTTPRLATYKPLVPPTPSYPSLSRKLT
ncbi:hypothetical protein B296_00015433 [Ensete ventricosum]|uniref:Uncharacterized protein n=1 Tax=Ensete ventricosum TaxID=4639 RepID=A0A426YMB6_ENSVE|nr:hypothetical protein B296_00015433 [Ensete ventricosum]